MTDVTIGGGLTIEFDTAIEQDPVTTAYDEATRTALTGDTLIKVRDLAIKSNLPDKLTKQLQVTTFDPSELKNSNNFFNFVGQWQTYVQLMETHFTAFYIKSPFYLVKYTVTPPSAADMEIYNAELQVFLMDALAAPPADRTLADGAIVVFRDAAGDPVLRPVNPVSVRAVEPMGIYLLTQWQNVTIEQVLVSVELMYKHVTSNVHRQNLVWSFSYMMDCLDADLRQYVLAKLSSYPSPYNHTGPMVFIVVAKRMMATTENLAQKVISAFISLRLTHFPAESVVECIFTVRNLLKFLRYGEPDSFAPRTTTTLIFDVLKGTSVNAFRAYVQQLQDFELKDGTPEDIFDAAQTKYDELILSDRWVVHSKKKSSFLAGKYADAEKKNNGADKKPEQKEEKKDADGKKDDKGRWLVDKRGNKIDRTQPKAGEPHERTNEKGFKEWWCGNPKCRRWGNHSTDKHKQWNDNWKNWKNNDVKKESESTASATQTNGRSVTFLSALTSGSIIADPELVDGIDL